MCHIESEHAHSGALTAPMPSAPDLTPSDAAGMTLASKVPRRGKKPRSQNSLRGSCYAKRKTGAALDQASDILHNYLLPAVSDAVPKASTAIARLQA
jgi:hypothetical protein